MTLTTKCKSHYWLLVLVKHCYECYMSLNAYILTINENGYQSIFTNTDVATQSQPSAKQNTCINIP